MLKSFLKFLAVWACVFIIYQSIYTDEEDSLTASTVDTENTNGTYNLLADDLGQNDPATSAGDNVDYNPSEEPPILE